MRKFLLGRVVVSAGAAFQPGVPPDTQPDHTGDPRYQALYRFFHKTGCPVRDHVGAFLEAADDYDLDWRLLPSLSFIESTGGKMARSGSVIPSDCNE